MSGETLRPDIRAETVWHLHRQDDVAQIACHHQMFGKMMSFRFGQGDYERNPTYERTMELMQQEFPAPLGFTSWVDEWLAMRAALRQFWHHALTGLAVAVVLAIFAGPAWASLGVLATLIYLFARGLHALHRKYPDGSGDDIYPNPFI